MRNRFEITSFILLLVMFCFGAYEFTLRAQSNQQLSETQKLKAQVVVLRSQLLQCQATAENGNLTVERAKLESEFRKQLGAKDEEVFDWTTLTFKSSPQSSK